MRHLTTTRDVKIPEGVSVEIKSRTVRVKGPRGVLVKSLKHTDFQAAHVSNQKIRVTVYHGSRKHLACIRTICAHIENMIKGVTKGFEYKLRFVYAHFPINVNVVENGSVVEIRNFLGEKVVRRVQMGKGVTAEISTAQKDELIVKGNDLNEVSQSAASIQQSCQVRHKDIRKFLDGIYVSERGLLIKD